jgi:phosphatidylserine decarboxylase
MSRPPISSAPLGKLAVAALTTEFARHDGLKSGLLIGARPDSPVLLAMLDALTPGDKLTLIPADESASGVAELRGDITARGAWVAERVHVVSNVVEADPADVAVFGEPLTGAADATRARLDEVGKHLNAGAVLTVATLAAPGMADGAAAELSRQSAFYGVGSDLVIRNRPPLHVHRLRFSPADAATAEALRPAFRPSSVCMSRSMNIDSNGVAAAGIAIALAAVAKLSRRKSKLWLVPALAAAPVAAFFRDPERLVPQAPEAVVAASDGKVLSVEHLVDTRLGETEFLRIAVFLSVLDVHVNRAPVAGRVSDYFVEDGGFAAAMKPEAEHNVAAYTVLDTPRGSVVVAQRTGLIARRIVQRAPVGSMLAKGERFGLIRFGSRTDVYLPAASADAAVAPGDKVRGGQTVIANWR